VTPLSEATAYSTLVDGGVHHGPRSVLGVRNGSGEQLFGAPAKPRGQRVISARVADQVKEVLGEVVTSGTGTAARQPFPVYGKTGTTDDFTNAWFTGCSDTVCIAVWMGYDKQYLDHGRVAHSMKNIHGVPEVFGGTLPAEVFAKAFDNYRALQHPSPSSSPTPVRTTSVPAQTHAPQKKPPTSTGRPAPRPTQPSPTQPPPTTPAESPTPSPSESLLPTPSARPS
jgi:membrane peptidoglycan carboxypeptidase